jgi:hypothetical protein
MLGETSRRQTMNPELTTTLAAQHNHELTAAAGRRALARQARPGRSGRLLASPYRVTWTRVRLALSDGGRPRTSWTIVISATRAR